MRQKPIAEVERGRLIVAGYWSSTIEDGNNGMFELSYKGVKFLVMASNGLGWEHVSISPREEERTPTWEEMNHFKELFWREDEAVVQYHPPRKDYVNFHPFVLHLWKPTFGELPIPPWILVGPKMDAEQKPESIRKRRRH